MSKFRRADDCLALLSYVAEHPDEEQSYRTLSEATGVQYVSLWNILQEARERPFDSTLAQIAHRYRFDFKVPQIAREGRLIYVIKRGYGI